MNINWGSAPPDQHMYLYRKINRSLRALCGSIRQVDEINGKEMPVYSEKKIADTYSYVR